MRRKDDSRSYPILGPVLRVLCLLAVLGVLVYANAAAALTVNVQGINRDGTAPSAVTNYRWVLEEDNTYHVQFDANGAPIPDPNTLSVSFHRNYMPVVAQGDDPSGLATVPLDPTKHYYLSVLPREAGTYSMGGAQIAPGQTTVTVTVHQQPIPTAQITIFVFHDNFPINNAPDLPEETGLAGFSLLVEDGGGRYGMSAGRMTNDAFGNPLGTTYQFTDTDGDGIHDQSEPFVMIDGVPVVQQMGTGVVLTDANGEATVKYLAPGKYGIQAVPPAGQNWQQTSTIEGTKVIDAWVKADEPPFFQEFGPAGWHVFIGFIQPFVDATVLTGGSTISGQVVNQHLSRPPDYAFYNGAPFAHTRPWVGLNTQGGVGRGAFAARCNEDGSFSIPNVPPGSYQLAIWDDALDVIFAFHQVTVAGSDISLGDVPVFQWFTRLESYVFNDLNLNGYRDAGEEGILEQAVNIRWRDGTMYQSAPTDGEGFVPFDQVFPFFAWLVAEVDFLRYKATGVTATVDNGGPIDPAGPYTFGGQLSPQPQFCTQADIDAGECFTLGAPLNNPVTGDNLQRTYTGPVLTLGFQGFLGQTSVLEWGKAAYAPGENGGISGIVYYSTTRAEDDPRWGAAEPWEPGVPRVTVNLWNQDKTLLLNTTTTDSWDDNLPSGCQGEVFVFNTPNGSNATDCYDGLRNFNQVRPAVFDGGYAFTTYFVDGTGNPVVYGTPGAVEAPLPAGEYVVEVIPPTGYQIVKEEDKNVDFGDNYIPSPQLEPPYCSNWDDIDGNGIPGRLVPPELDLFPGVAGAYAGQERPLCDRKRVLLTNGSNAAADFFIFTKTPIAGHIYGFILDDTQNEFDPNAPNFGEKFAPPWLPVSIRDWTGLEIARTYSDQYGVYNALVPSTYSANLPMFSGMSPNMITVCLNSPLKPDPANPGQFIPDPLFNPQYSQFCYNFQYMPGATTYLDTPVIPVAAFAGPGQFPLDCEFPDGTPVIASVSNTAQQGPWISAANGTQTISITSPGLVEVPNPAYDGVGGANPKTIQRDYGFGTTEGTVRIGNLTVSPAFVTWSNLSISVRVPVGVTTGQLLVTRADNGITSPVGVTLTVGGAPPIVVGKDQPVYKTIQSAIDAAAPNTLITVKPGSYEEMVIMWKPVRLQGWGARSVAINAVKIPTQKLVAWRQKIQNLIDPNGDGNPADGVVDLLPGQEIGFGGVEPVTLFNEEGAGILVLARNRNPNQGGFGNLGNNNNIIRNARIDGLTVTGADHAGGIVVNGYAHYLEIGNNRIVNNNGVYGGGIRLGHPELTVETNQGLQYQSAFNDNILIHHNHVTQNGCLNVAGGGITLATGSDRYQVTENYVCGNITLGQGGGISHIGLSDGGLIGNNKILFNESFNQGITVSGGGLFIGGGAPLAVGGLSPGVGNVKVNGNLIQGNGAGAGDGGGIRLHRVNGADVARQRNQPNQWFSVDLTNNMIVNNVAGMAGGGISLQDVAMSKIIHNTISHNESTGTAGAAFPAGSPNQSTPQPAGVVSYAHSPELAAAFGNVAAVTPYKVFSNALMADDIIWRNRSFFFLLDDTPDPPLFGLCPDIGGSVGLVCPGGNNPVYADLGVVGAAGALNPVASILSTTAGANPAFVQGYFNGQPGQTIAQPEITTAIQAPPAFDEGGNFIRLHFGPLTACDDLSTADGDPGLCSNYHIGAGSTAINAGINLNAALPVLARDYDNQPRPFNIRVDIGADERQPLP